MKNTEVMIKEKIWAGLNDPGCEAPDVVVLSVPYDGGVSFRAGAKEGPQAIRSITYTVPPTTEHFKSLKHVKVKDLGDIHGLNRKELFENTKLEIMNLVKSKTRFTVIGGDHSITIPILEAVNDALDQSFAIVHIDAHFDLCESLEGDRLSHGSTQRRALDLDHVTSEGQFFVGIRSVEEDELDFISRENVHVINAYEFNQIGVKESVQRLKNQLSGYDHIYLTIDIDCLDPAYAAGTGTPQTGGLTSRQLLDFLKELFTLNIIGFDLVEVAPKLDSAWTSVFAARKIIMECWGHWFT